MKKKIVAIIAVIALMGLLLPATVFAADTGAVTCTVSAVLVSVSVTDGNVAYGTIALGQTKSTLDVTDTQHAQNNGTVAENFEIKSSDATRAGGTDWNLIDSGTPGNNEFTHGFSKDSGSSWSILPTSNDYTPLAHEVAVSGTQNFDLRITMPSSTTDYLEHSITVTVRATEHTT